MFDKLTYKIERAFKILKGQGAISQTNISETLKEIRRALLDADVNYKIAKQFTQDVKDKALGAKVLNSISPGQLLLKITQEELSTLMGSKHVALDLQKKPTIIMVAGLQGAGKTTLCGKLGHYCMAEKKTPFFIACDIYRPAAIEQLNILSQKVGAEIYLDLDQKNPLKIAYDGIKKAKQAKADVIIIDTAGRLSIDEKMMDELKDIEKKIKPHEVLFVADSMMGQDAVMTAKNFNAALPLTGIILTKMDADAKAGAALSIKTVVEKPIKFIGTGERLEDLEKFHPDRIASQILGKGDIVSLVEKAEKTFDEKEAKSLNNKFKNNSFDFNDLLSQMKKVEKMGNISQMINMIPGAGKLVKKAELEQAGDKIKNLEVLIQSMTPAERTNPSILNGIRKKRIAKGAGKKIEDVNRLIKQLEDLKKMMKHVNKSKKGNFMPSLPRFP